MGRFPIGTKLWFMSAFALLGILIVSTLSLYKYYDTMIEGRKEKIENLINIVHDLVNYHYETAASGNVTVEEAKENIKQEMKVLRYQQDSEYFFVFDLDAKIVFHPIDQTIIGKDYSNFKDESGNYFVREMVKGSLENKNGYVEYMWPKPGLESEGPKPKLSYYKLFEPWGWIIGTGIYIDDVSSAFWNNTVIIGGIIIFIIIGLIVISLLIIRSILPPIKNVQSVLKVAASGDLRERTQLLSDDEIGQMSGHINQFLSQFSHSIEEVSQASTSVSSASEELNVTAAEMYRYAEHMRNESTTAQTAVKHVTVSVQNLSLIAEKLSVSADSAASAAEQMQASISEVAQHAERSSTISREATGFAHQAETVLQQTEEAVKEAQMNIKELDRAGNQIGEVVKLISDIAEQTNLLALNATIEAARAGEAGKGFAVVAGEVKSLANQSAKATDEIAAKIDLMRDYTQKSVSSMAHVGQAMGSVTETIENIHGIIERVDDIANAIASEMEEQAVTTKEIGQTVSEVAVAARDVAKDTQSTAHDAETMQGTIKALSDVAQETASAAHQTSAASGELSRLAGQLDGLVSRFDY